MPANLENSAVATGLEKAVFIPIPKKGNAKERSNYRTIALIAHASKVMLKILQPRLQHLGRKVMTNLDSIFKSRDITLPTKVRLIKAMVFPFWSCMDVRVGL